MPALLLYRKKNKHVAEYALRGSIPTIEEIEAKLARDLAPESPRKHHRTAVSNRCISHHYLPTAGKAPSCPSLTFH
jgi:hypothetical protein